MKKVSATLSGHRNGDPPPHRGTRWALGAGFVVLAAICGPAGAESTAPPLVCSQGPAGQRFHAGVTMPAQAEAGSIYAVRIDGVSSGKVTHFGLNYIHDMTVDYVFPASAYVEGSAQLVPGTGTANVIAGANLSYGAGLLEMNLPGKVGDGSQYTPPSVQFQLRASGAPGSPTRVSFSRFRLRANAIVVGDVDVSCEPTPKPYPIGTTLTSKSARTALHY
jgi:hypothetical protein